jgi:hypothetical protein
MKALKSQLATKLLADPQARDQLRRFMTAKHVDSSASGREAGKDVTRIQLQNGESFTVVVVPKAKTA